VRTLNTWANALEAHRDQTVATTSEEVYERYMHYLTGCRELFRDGYTDVCQFTLEKSAA
jgi:cyclopropane-fatty-acyl-phospholipid synthase